MLQPVQQYYWFNLSNVINVHTRVGEKLSTCMNHHHHHTLCFNLDWRIPTNHQDRSPRVQYMYMRGWDLINKETYYERFENHVSPKANPVFARFKFHSRVQESSETAEKFITALRILVQDCDFKDPEEMIRDRILFGTNSLKVREKLISKGAKLTLDKAIEIARSHESSQAQLTAMAAETADRSIHLVQRRNREKETQDTQHQNHPPSHQVSSPFKPPGGTRTCRNCGRHHNTSATCPAHGKTCLYCKKLNHFAEVCQSRARRQRIHAIEDSRDSVAETTFESIVFESVTIANLTHGTPESSRDEVFVSIQVNLAQSDNRNTTLKAKLDTGAQGNILPMRLYREMFPHQVDNNGKLKPKALLSSNVVLTAYGGSQIKHHGIVTIPCTYGKESTLAPFYVTDIPGPAIIGLPTSTALNLLQFNCAIQTQHPHTSNHGCIKDKNLQPAKNHTHWSQTAITCWTTSWSSNPGQPPEENPQRRLKWSSHPQTRGEAGAAKILPWQVRKATSCTNTRTKSKHPGSNDTEMETSRSDRKACRGSPIICCVNPDWKRAEAH